MSIVFIAGILAHSTPLSLNATGIWTALLVHNLQVVLPWLHTFYSITMVTYFVTHTTNTFPYHQLTGCHGNMLLSTGQNPVKSHYIKLSMSYIFRASLHFNSESQMESVVTHQILSYNCQQQIFLCFQTQALYN